MTPCHVDSQVNIKALQTNSQSSRFNHRHGHQPHGQPGNQASDSELVLGIDEVGRGPLYGSVVIAAVVLPNVWTTEHESDMAAMLQSSPLSGLTDSKKLSQKKRQQLSVQIKQHAIAYAIVDVPSTIIDEFNILAATMLGMKTAAQTAMIIIKQALVTHIKGADKSLRFRCLFDGNKTPSIDESCLIEHGIDVNDVTCEAWIKGDGRHASIAAASVLAKVARDASVTADAQIYPEYGLDQHKGYPTKAHLLAINNFGILPKHRRSFKPIKAAMTDKSS